VALVEGSCQPGAGQEARSPVILGVRRSETVSPIFTLMTLVESEPLPHLTQDSWKTPRAGHRTAALDVACTLLLWG